MDSRFRVHTLGAMQSPQLMCWAAMHTDYSEKFIIDEIMDWPTETEAGHSVVRNLLKGHKGHYGPLEHPSIIFAVGGFPHSVMQQARTHRIASFDVQSFRYTGSRIVDVAKGVKSVQDVFYFRPVGKYKDRQGNDYEYNESLLNEDMERAFDAALHYERRFGNEGLAPEHARGVIPFDVRQNFVVSFNMRSLMHFLTIRGKMDAQMEIRQLCELTLPCFQSWSPEIGQWFVDKLWRKGRLAP